MYLINHHHRSKNYFRCKLQSSVCCFSSHDNHVRNYLENWAGAGRLKPRAPSQPSAAAAAAAAVGSFPAPSPVSSTSKPTSTTKINSYPQLSLQVTGSSYLLPTLCLPRHATSSSLSSELESFLHTRGNSGNHHSAIQSMLKPKSLPGTSTSLRVPIILDLATYQHDGSPHYKPPCEGFLPLIVETLDKWGISVMGLTNVPNIDTIGDDVHSLGLPVLGRVGSGRILGKNGKKGGRDAVSIEDLVQLVLKQSNHEENVTSDTKTNYTEDADVSVDNIGTVNDDAEKCDNQVPTIGDDNTIIRDKELSMSLSELQKACDTLGLDATGPISELYDKILTLNGLEPMKQRQSDTDASDDTIVQKAHSDSFPPNVNIPPPKLYHGSVRSGQQVSTDEPNQSLVILGNVNSGGEVISDGDIYIFGHLRGRAIAGLSDSQRNVQDSACTGQGGGSGSVIVCTHFDAELVCIGESFTTMDGSLEDYGLKNGKGVIIRRNENDSLLKFMCFG